MTTENLSQDLSQEIVRLLKEKNMKISFAESCTGGMVSAAITSVEGASGILDLSITTYANQAKIQYTDVTEEVLAAHGAVSEQTAALMASGIRKRSASDIGVGITGIAGPGGGSREKPVGTVYIAINYGENETLIKHFAFIGDRQSVRSQTTEQALRQILPLLK